MLLHGCQCHHEVFSRKGCELDPSIPIWHSEEMCHSQHAAVFWWLLIFLVFEMQQFGFTRYFLGSIVFFPRVLPLPPRGVRKDQREKAYYSSEQEKGKSECHFPTAQSLALLWWLMSKSLSFYRDLPGTARWRGGWIGPLQSLQIYVDCVSPT